MWFALSGAALAATWTVGGGGDFSAIQPAINAASDGDTLRVAPGTYVESLDLLGKDLAIIGTNAALAPPATRPAASWDQGETGSLEGFSVRTSGARAFVVQSSTVTLRAVTVTTTGVLGATDGGAVYISRGFVTVEASTFQGSAGRRGGAFYVEDGSLSLTDVTTSAAAATWGGALFATRSTVTATRWTVTSPRAEFSGAGIYLDSTALTATDLNVSGALGDRTWGAGLAAMGTSLVTLDGGTFFHNNVGRAAEGYGGGALYIDGRSTLRAVGTTFTNNTAALGGAIAVRGGSTASLEDCTIEDSSALLTGGAIDVRAASLDTVATLMRGNAAAQGGAVAVGTGGDWVDALSVLSGSDATGDGGAAWLHGATVLDGTTFDGNVAGGSGGAVFADTAGSLSFVGATVRANRAKTDGGGVAARGAMTLAVEDSTFEDGLAELGDGGAINFRTSGASPFSLTKSAFARNTAGRHGGHLAIEGGNIAIADVTLALGAAARSGGGARLSLAQSINTIRTTWYGNSAGERGGALDEVDTVGTSRHESSSVSENTAFEGGGFALERAASEVLNISFVGNAAAANGGHLWIAGKPARLISSLFAFAADGGAVWLDPAAALTDLFYGDAWLNAGGDVGGAVSLWPTTSGNLTEDPRLVAYTLDGDPMDDDLHLDPLSPCRDAGDPTRRDLDGTRSDIGAYGGPHADVRDRDLDSYFDTLDCDDGDPLIHPGALEIPYDGIDDDCDGTDLVDVDEDGFVAVLAGGDDCDDDLAYVHPGAIDPPYDSLDANCDGVADDDQDGDGYLAPEVGGPDCNDGDSTIHPDAFDLPYDGVDADCDAGDDFDADRDGFRSLGFVDGTDCDDTDAGIHPGAIELPYDAIDWDCDGLDPDDLDEDGYPGGPAGTDCDDTDPDVHPGTLDVWYDGLDADCAGNDDFDMDADGFRRDTDCDDARSDAHPGAAEQNNGLDDDCDGWAETDDRDNDGLVDKDEWTANTDPNVVDSDGDGRRDGDELEGDLRRDSDGDGLIDALDNDDDNDTIPTAHEDSVDVDGDGAPDLDIDYDGLDNAHDLDADADGRPDGVEGELDIDHDGVPDFADYTGDLVGGGCAGGDHASGLFALPLALLGWRRPRRRTC